MDFSWLFSPSESDSEIVLEYLFYIVVWLNYSATAIASTSQSTFFGSCFTATQERAGLLVKYFSYTALNAAKSAISARKHVVLMTLSNVSPASSRIAPTFLQECYECV